MKTTLFLSVSIDGMIADKQGIPMFPQGAWEDWCSLVNDTGNVIAGRSSFEQVNNPEMGAALHPQYKIVLSSKDLDLSGTDWQQAKSPIEALKILEEAKVDEAIIGGGRAVAHAFMREGLVDEIVIDLHPVAFGEGVPMFGDAIDAPKLKLIESKSISENALRLRYEIIG
ncbi:MAG: dihydrofolate reductase family protein [Gammaproteobacteria bacterium]|nr:dihydrofolate reductase family protein [Gammaproteobacteria bacterium]